MPFGTLLRQWRTARGLSQLALATDAGISTRHLSFLETGRAQPSREMVQLLAGMLDLPVADRNALLACAGYAPVASDDPIEPSQLESLRPALDFILRQQEPYPALVLDGKSNILMTNHGARETFGRFCRLPVVDKPINASRTVFDPDGLRPYIVNWDQCARRVLQSLQRELASTGSSSLSELREELLEYPGVPARWRRLDPAQPDPPLACMDLRKDGLSLAFFSTLTMLVAPWNATPQQVRIKSFFPADAATEQFARRLTAPQRETPPPGTWREASRAGRRLKSARYNCTSNGRSEAGATVCRGVTPSPRAIRALLVGGSDVAGARGLPPRLQPVPLR